MDAHRLCGGMGMEGGCGLFKMKSGSLVTGNDDHDRSRSMIAIIMMIDDRSLMMTTIDHHHHHHFVSET